MNLLELNTNIFYSQSAKPIIPNGLVSLNKFKGNRDKHHELELEINENAYMVLFDVEAYNYQGMYNDFDVTILEVAKCHVSKDEYKTLEQISQSELKQIENEVYNYWEKNMPDSFYDELGEDTDCKSDY